MPAAKNNKNDTTLSNNDASDNHVAGGFKATLSNDKASDEAKKHAQEMLDKAGVDADERKTSSGRRDDLTEEEKHRHHIEGGYKATLSNDKASEEAKKHAQEMLDKLAKGEELPESENAKYRRGDLSEEEKHRHHIEGGYKATLSNEKASEEAKKHAQEMLDKLANGEELPESENAKYRRGDLSEEEKHRHHIEGGYKATLSNEKSSDEAKKHAQEMLDKLAKGEELPESENAKYRRGDLSEEEKHRHHIEGGYKATLSNEKSSEEAKKHAQEMLDKLAKGEELPESERYRGRSNGDAEDDKRGLKRSSDDVEAEDKESGKGKQGFASMPKEKVQEIASKGGRTSNAGEEPSPKKSKSDESPSKSKNSESHKSDDSESGKGKQGFASMPKEKVQEIASKGGRTKHAGEEPAAVKNQ